MTERASSLARCRDRRRHLLGLDEAGQRLVDQLAHERGGFGTIADGHVSPYDVRRLDRHALEVDYTYYTINPVEPPGPDGSRPLMPTHYHYRIELPFASIFTLDDELTEAVNMAILMQDKPVVESQRPSGSHSTSPRSCTSASTGSPSPTGTRCASWASPPPDPPAPPRGPGAHG